MIKDVKSAYFSIVDTKNIGLAESFSVNPSSCENSGFYREYLQLTAISDLYSGENTTHLFIDEEVNRIMGFVSLRASSVISQRDDGLMEGSPALEVMVLAVNQEYERRGVGSALIDYIIALADELHKNNIGIQYIVLAADKLAVGFYEKMGFVHLEDRWYKIPKETWSSNCVPMVMSLNFEKDYIISFADDDDDEDNE